MGWQGWTLASCLLLAGFGTYASNHAAGDTAAVPQDLLLILDASNSMWGQIEGRNKIVIAREAVGGLIDRLPVPSRAGLVAYGHRREADCDDIEVLAPIGPLDKAGLKSTINGIAPKGRTPITASINTALGLVDQERQTSVVLVSDGVETCGLDPCSAVRTAKASGLPFVLHVVGFDLSEEDTAQLECAAQAGGGVFVNAGDASELSDALETVYEKPVTPAGRLIVKATNNGALQDVSIKVTDRARGEAVETGRTYTRPDTNPRRLALADGAYQAVVTAIGVRGTPEHRFEFDITDGGSVTRAFDFTTGELAVSVSENGALGDAVVRVMRHGTKERVDIDRTYRTATTNPAVLRLAAGHYDVRVKAVAIANAPERVFEGVVVTGNERTTLTHGFASGVLRVGARRGENLVDAVARVYDAEGGSVDTGRTYKEADSNPRAFVLSPGRYRIAVREIRGDSLDLTAEVTAGGDTLVMAEYEPATP